MSLTPHNGAMPGDFAKTVLMPGDPLRAKFIAETYLENPKLVTSIRNVYGYTGTYEGKRVSVMASGMGIPSIGIYCYELFNFYGVESIIRVGSAGAYHPDLKLFDIIIGQGACTDSNFAAQYNLPGTFAPIADFGLLRKAVDACEKAGARYMVGNLMSSDVFYNDDPEAWKKWRQMGVLGAEMEAAALYMTAARAGKKALAIDTISDILGTKEEATPEQRQTAFDQMIRVALAVAEE
jgi:purine-nucleoside phosphorylase